MDFLQDLGITTTDNAVNTLKEQVIPVFSSPSMIFCPNTDNLIKTGFHTISNAKGDIHGTVTSKHHILGMDTLIDIAQNVSIQNNLDFNFNKASLNYFKDNSIVTLDVPLETMQFQNKAGFKDVTNVNLYIKTGFGGNSCTEIGVYSKRLVCSNGLEIRNGLNYFKAKHTENMNAKAQTFLAHNLPKMMSSSKDFQNLAKQFDSKQITKADINNFRNSIFNVSDVNNISTRKENQMEQFNKVLDIELSRCGLTAWGLLQAATNYTNNEHSKGSEEFVRTGSGATFNDKALSLALAY